MRGRGWGPWWCLESGHEFTFSPMAFLQQVSNKWPCERKTLQNNIGKATAQEKKIWKGESPLLSPICMHVCTCVLYEENGYAQVQYVNVLSIQMIVLYQSINMIFTDANLFPQFRSPQGRNPGLSQLKYFTNSSYGKRICKNTSAGYRYFNG